jgi:phosphoglycolate phosphatase-like HAD superfamily hydrolase
MSRCIIVGDSMWDVLAARRACVLAVGVLSAGMEETNWNEPVSIVYDRIRPTSSAISMR